MTAVAILTFTFSIIKIYQTRIVTGNRYMKHILLSTTGASPQVLTETLYAIHQSGRPFPAEVFVITTASAKPELMNGLFRDGHLQALKEEY